MSGARGGRLLMAAYDLVPAKYKHLEIGVFYMNKHERIGNFSHDESSGPVLMTYSTPYS